MRAGRKDAIIRLQPANENFNIIIVKRAGKICNIFWKKTKSLSVKGSDHLDHRVGTIVGIRAAYVMYGANFAHKGDKLFRVAALQQKSRKP